MIKLFKVREKQNELAENANDGKLPVKKLSSGELRLQKVPSFVNGVDINDLNLPSVCTIKFPNGKDDLKNFQIFIHPDEGYYIGGNFLFSFRVSHIYPHEAPKVKCENVVYHPNIDLEGNVCLNVLREDWKPDPNHENPLNVEAGEVLRYSPKLFAINARRAMNGQCVGSNFYSRVI
ncbi:NEDD8-conjugating enzyme Ubc12-like [Impatiens glandulifera]|uniref:NEDD8-conjugating enzyme Ubc12-like n=1 Tax=Impatiens glandulifera TaxID=253017 RepID=UPI001FB085F2|nr:NEDD8-conjugating enzyme Ubc12-like [Impatiens glandulifera]